MNNKKELRRLYRSIRESVSTDEKQKLDKMIFSEFINSGFVEKHDVFLVYLSVKDEIDTCSLIEYLFECGKTVAIPFCEGKTMRFCKINSFDDTQEGTFGIPTARNPVFLRKDEIKGSLCIVPALSIDRNGNRLGYGGGFYDRFLSENDVVTVALCYERCLCESIPADLFDIPVQYILTEKILKKL